MRLIALLLLVLLPVTPVFAEETSVSSSPIEITANSMVSEEQRQQVVFTGDVVATQADIALYCQKLRVNYSKNGGQVERIEASTKVRLVQGDRIATGDKGVFDQTLRTMVLQGNAQAIRGKNVIKGEVITIYLDEDRSEVRSKDGGRVRAIFFPRKAAQ